MSKIISIANFKGGVGKTTSCVNIGAGLAKAGKRVLLLDMDAQHNLSQSFLVDADDLENVTTSYQILTGVKPVPHEIEDNLFIIPSSLDLIKAQTELVSKFKREYILEGILKPLRESFDFIIIDCPPSLGIITVNSFIASDLIFTPIEAEYLSLKGFSILSEALDNIGLQIDRVFISKFDGRKVLNQSVKNNVLDALGEKAFKTVIRSNIALAEAPTAGRSIFDYAPRSNGANDYKSLTNEILKNYE